MCGNAGVAGVLSLIHSQIAAYSDYLTHAGVPPVPGLNNL